MRTLILKFGAIGDVLMVIPAAYELHLLGHQVDWICGRAVLPLLALYPWINPIPIDERALLTGSLAARLAVVAKLWRTLAGRRYDLAATLYYDRRYRLLTASVRARRRLLLSPTDRALRLIPGRHHSDEFARILLGWPDQVRPVSLAPVPPPAFPVASHPRVSGRAGPRILLCPGGARNMLADDQQRRWPTTHYVTLAHLLSAAGCEVVLIGGPTDTWVKPLFAGLPVTDLIGTLPIDQTLAVMQEADLVVTHDTGPLHLAGITAARVVALFGPTSPHTFAPRRPGVVALWGGEGFACRPCHDGRSFAPCPDNQCLGAISPTVVHAEINALLAATPAPPLRIATPAPVLYTLP